MITYKFIAGDGTDSFAEFTEIKAMSLKKAIKKYSTPSEFCTFVVIYWTSRKGNGGKKVISLPYKPRSERKGRL